MTSNQLKLIELSKQYEAARDAMKEINEQLAIVSANVVKETGLNTFFQDNDGTVFRVVKPTGTYIAFKELTYERTRRHPKEKPGISLKEAREAGFTVE